MHSYLKGIDSATGASKTVARLADVLNSISPKKTRVHGELAAPDAAPNTDLAPPAAKTPETPAELLNFLRSIKPAHPNIKDGYRTIGGAAAGALLFKGHPILGAIGGASLGRNVPALFSVDRNAAFGNFASTGAGIAGSLYFKAHPVIGFILGSIVGNIAASFVVKE